MTWMALSLRPPDTDPSDGRTALEASGIGPACRSDPWWSVGEPPSAMGSAVDDIESVWVATTALGELRSNSVRAMLSTGLLPRRCSGPDAQAVLWCGQPIDSLVAGVRRLEREIPAPAPGREADVDDVVREVRAAVRGVPVLYDATVAARALIGLSYRTEDDASFVCLRWGGSSAVEESPSTVAVLDASTLDVRSLFDAYVAEAEVPSATGFQTAVVEALVTRAGLARGASAVGGHELFAWGADARIACRRPRPRFLRRRFRPVADALDVLAARRAEIAGLEGAPIHRMSSIVAVLPTQTREAIAHFGPRAVPRGLTGVTGIESMWSVIATLGLGTAASNDLESARVVRPFASREVRDRVDSWRHSHRSNRSISPALLTRWALTGPVGTGAPVPTFDDFLDGAMRGELSSRIDDALALACRSPAFVCEGVAQALVRFRARAGGWSARRIMTVALLALFLDRERLSLSDA